MDPRPLYAADQDLVATAEATLADRFDPERHPVAGALRTADGAVYTAVNVESTLGPASTHAEPVALERALADGHEAFDATVAVTYPEGDPTRDPRVLAPCGVCRELLSDYDRTMDAIVRTEDGRGKVRLAELLPARG